MFDQNVLSEPFYRALILSSDNPSIVTRTKTSLSRSGQIRTVSDLIDLYKNSELLHYHVKSVSAQRRYLDVSMQGASFRTIIFIRRSFKVSL